MANAVDNCIVNVRLECLRMAHRHDKSEQDIVARAEVYEAYVLAPLYADTPSDDGPADSAEPRPRRGRPPKTTQKPAP